VQTQTVEKELVPAGAHSRCGPEKTRVQINEKEMMDNLELMEKI